MARVRGESDDCSDKNTADGQDCPHVDRVAPSQRLTREGSASGFFGAATGFLGFRRFLCGRRESPGGSASPSVSGGTPLPARTALNSSIFFKSFFEGGTDLSKIGVIVVAGTAPHLRGFPVDNRDNGVIGQAATLDAIIVDNVTQPKFIHRVGLAF